jgi:hypothetical protein
MRNFSLVDRLITPPAHYLASSGSPQHGLVAETILASVHVRAPKPAGSIDASDLIDALQTPCEAGAVHKWKIAVES